MRAFISYSLSDSEQYVITILASRLKEQGFVVSSSYNLFSNAFDYSQLDSSSLYIGIIMDTSHDLEIKRVYNEWSNAIERNIPALLLIDNSLTVENNLRQYPNVIFFNRAYPDQAINIVQQKIANSRNEPFLENLGKSTTTALAWILGGAAVISLIGLLSNEKKVA